MMSWESHIQQEEIINHGKYLDTLQEACSDFCKLVINEAVRIKEFQDARINA